MKREDFFEALTDIDEKMIAAAGDLEQTAGPAISAETETDQPARPIIVTTPKKNRKPLITAAACVLLAAAATATAAAVLNRTQLGFVPLVEDKKEYKTIVNIINGNNNPYELYEPFHDYSSISEMKCISDKYPDYPNPSKFSSYEELAEQSQLVVMGTFTNNSGQATTWDNIPDFSQAMKGDFFNKYLSFNTLKVEKVLKGNGTVWAGDEIIITQPYTVVYDLSDEYNIYSFSQLTPMQKGDKWIYFLNPNGDYPDEEIWGKSYSAVNDYEGRYPVPGEENAPFKYRENVKGVIAPAVFNEGIYSELAGQLEKADTSPRPTYVMDYEKVINPFEPFLNEDDYPGGLPMGFHVQFEMEEFEDVIFGWEGGALYTDADNGHQFRTGIYALPGCIYLCDLNGDGRRELCASISIGSGIVSNFIYVLDYYNDRAYMLDDRGERDYFLEKKDGELYLLSYKFSFYCDEDDRDEKAELLTMDMLREIGGDNEGEVSQPQESEAPDKTDFPSENVIMIMDPKNGVSYPDDMTVPFWVGETSNIQFRFDREPKFIGDILLGDVLSVTENYVTKNLLWADKINAIYLCDLNGDGNNEICVEARFDHLNFENSSYSTVFVYDHANDTRYVLSNDSDCSGYSLAEKDDVLYILKSGESEVISEDPITLDSFIKCDPSAYKNIAEHKFGEENAKMLWNSGLESNLDRLHETLEFRLEEFPDIIFRKKAADEPLPGKDIFEIEVPFANNETVFCGFPITSMYIGDLNGDEYREICLTYSTEPLYDGELINAVDRQSRVIVIDYAENKVYTMRDNEHNFRLGITDDKVMVSKFDFETGELVDDEPLNVWSMDIFGGGDN